MPSVTWYFDFVSPYAYFGLQTLNRLPPATELRYEPILFAGLLNHWGQKGPAEIATKRIWTYRACIWWAQENHIEFRMPAAHPFNSLPYLRLALAAGNSREAIEVIFRSLWTTGDDPADPKKTAELAESLQVSPQRISDPAIKDSLRNNTTNAVRHGIFGVPSFLINGQIFWGSDSVEFAAAYLRDPSVLSAGEMALVDALPVAASRI